MSNEVIPGRNRPIIVGLGNPGAHYQGTRHNVGFLAIDAIAFPQGVFERRGLSLVLEGLLDTRPAVFAKPQTYMNRSGEAFIHLLDRYKVTPQDLVVIYDDAEIPFGEIRVRQRGSHGGHNGMKSISQALGTSEIPRIRLGIGRNIDQRSSLASHVLQDFTDAERAALPKIFAATKEAIMLLVDGQAAKAMSLYNRRDLAAERPAAPAGEGDTPSPRPEEPQKCAT